MIKNWQTMADYRAFFKLTKANFDSSERSRLHAELWNPWQKVRIFDTDRAMEFLLPLYSPIGRPATNQPQIIRSFILLLSLHSEGLTKASLTAWVDRLKHDRVLATLIGCTCESLPPLGSYYDFMDRLWSAPDSDLYRRDKLLPASWNRKKPERPKGKGQKAQESAVNITERIEKRLNAGKDIPFNFEATLQEFFFAVAVRPSVEAGLIDLQALTASGDGTAVHTHASPYGRSTPESRALPSYYDDPASAPRHYSDPDASWGWDSDMNDHYFGYTLFHISCHNEDSHADLPLLLRFTSARRHDSVNFLVAFHEFQKHLPGLSPRDMCLDSAMDNYPTYRLLKESGIRAFIDLNSNRGRPKTIPDQIRIDTDGTPICSAGHRMVPNGSDRSNGCRLWRCPYVTGRVSQCDCICSPSSYGRVVKTKAEWDIRLYTEVPRGTDTYKKIYSQRTATERINNRILNDYGLHGMMIHTKKHYSFMTTMIGICLHLDARLKQLRNQDPAAA